jgi:hypothetical protein
MRSSTVAGRVSLLAVMADLLDQSGGFQQELGEKRDQLGLLGSRQRCDRVCPARIGKWKTELRKGKLQDVRS